ncbi:MAG: helix-turn-helix transcriptional regulator [Clostridia bacterium]|nr:helix-turn-helix transcriptional regulator [Clostridia bacterium]
MDKQAIGKFIAEQRKAKQLTQKQLADKLNVTDKAVSKWETGKCYPDVETLERLSNFFDVTVNDVLYGRILSQNNTAEEADKNILPHIKKARKQNKYRIIVICIVMCPLILYFLFCMLKFTNIIPSFFADTAEVNGLQITYYQPFNTAFAGRYSPTLYTDNFEITVPDEYNNIPIEKLGGLSGSSKAPFCIDISDLYMNTDKNSEYNAIYRSDTLTPNAIEENISIQNVVFRLNIGENIKEIEYVDMDEYYPHLNKNGTVTFYHPVVEIYCSEDNEHFYSKDGKLYNKATKELITDFAYSYIGK